MSKAVRRVPPDPRDLAAFVKREAAALGFDAVGITRTDAIGAAGDKLQKFLAAGRHGDMDWLETTAERRADPRVLWPAARSVVMLAMSYAPAEDPLAHVRPAVAGEGPAAAPHDSLAAAPHDSLAAAPHPDPLPVRFATGRGNGASSPSPRSSRGEGWGEGQDLAPTPADRSALSLGVVSVYARGRDYHDVIKGRLKQIAGKLAARSGADVKVFVDTAPLMEKPLAAAAGLGWQGKHTNLVSRQHGSWLFLGAILTTAEVAADTPEADHCGSCRACLDVCPTQAFPAPYQLDARRCIAYLTIEHQDHIPAEMRPAIGNRVFGCDDCLAVCPWNKFAAAAREARFSSRIETAAPPLADLLALDDAAFRRRFAGTPVKRTGHTRFLRNVLIAAGNAGDPELADHVARHLDDVSPLVRAMAVWALARLLPPERVRALTETRAKSEPDPAVVMEWEAALASSEMHPRTPARTPI